MTPTPRLKVAVVNPFGVVGGAERWLLQLLDATDRLVVEAVLLSDGPLRHELEARGIPVSVLPTGTTGAAIAVTSARLAAALRGGDAEVVLANGVKAAAAVIPAARLAGVRAVWAKHDFAWDGPLTRALGRLADGLVAVSDEVAAGAARTAVIVPPPRPGTPLSAADARALWAERGLPDDGTPTLAVVARLIPVKGVDDAIRALAQDADAWRLAVVGGDDPTAPGERDRLAALAKELGVEERVHLLGDVPGAARALAAFDALAVLTRVDERGFGREGFGMTALEALAAGVPVIGASTSPVVATLAAKAGVVVPPGDPVAVAAALRRLEGADRAGLTASARIAVADHPDARTCAARLVSVLASTALRPGAGLVTDRPVSVVVPALDEGPQLDRVVSALVPQLGDDDELLLVEAGSSDDTPERARAWAQRDHRVRVLEHEGPGTLRAAAGRNRAIARARHDVVLCTDAGCTPAPGWVDALRSAFAEEPARGLVTGSYRVTGRSVLEDAVAAANYPVPEEARRPGPLVRAYWALLGRGFEADAPAGRSMAVSVAAWEAVGGFPEDLATAEDVTLGRRIVAAGFPYVLSLDAEVGWDPRPTLRATARMYHRYGMGDGQARDRKALARTAARGVAYLAGPHLAVRGGRGGRLAALAGAALYFSLPLARARHHERPLAVAAAVPVVVVTKDLAKIAGSARGLLRRG